MPFRRWQLWIDTFELRFLFFIQFPLKVSKGPMNEKSSLVEIMSLHRSGDKPLSKQMTYSSTCITQPDELNQIYAVFIVVTLIYWQIMQMLYYGIMTHWLLSREQGTIRWDWCSPINKGWVYYVSPKFKTGGKWMSTETQKNNEIFYILTANQNRQQCCRRHVHSNFIGWKFAYFA